MVLVLLVFALFALAGFIGRTARERGRSAIAWVALAIVAMLAASAAGAWSLGASILGGDDTALSLGKVTFGLLASLVGPLAAMAVVLGAVWKLPERVPRLAGARWRVYRLSSPDEPAGECELAVADGRALHVGEWCIGPGELDELVADGECLRVTAGARSRTLMPAGDGLSSREKAKRSQALAKRLGSLLR
ncbi:MAG TPA: hypothetical protein VF945_05605 [Polyangia bacterium]